MCLSDYVDRHKIYMHKQLLSILTIYDVIETICIYRKINYLYNFQLITAVLINNVKFLLCTLIHLYIYCIHLYNCISLSRQSQDTDDSSTCI